MLGMLATFGSFGLSIYRAAEFYLPKKDEVAILIDLVSAFTGTIGLRPLIC